MGETCGTHGGEQIHKQVLVGKPEGNRTLKKSWGRCEDYIKIDPLPADVVH